MVTEAYMTWGIKVFKHNIKQENTAVGIDTVLCSVV